MKIYPEELLGAKLFWKNKTYPEITKEQKDILYKRVEKYIHLPQKNPNLHNWINLGAFVFLFTALFSSIIVPALIIENTILKILVASFFFGVVMVNMTIFTLHEGAGHDSIFVGTNKFWSLLKRLSFHSSRLFFCEPDYYHACHIHHHRDFGTDKDAAYTNFVWPKRYLTSLIWSAGVMPFNDYRIHISGKQNRSYFISQAVGLSFFIPLFLIAGHFGGYLYAFLVTMILGPWLCFVLDRTRETFEHNLMPESRNNGTRSIGLNLIGWTVGGGPWGQPCHLSHHLFPALPWYGQCILHKHFKEVFTPEQRDFFLVQSYGDFVKKYIYIFKNSRSLVKEIKSDDQSESLRAISAQLST